MKKTHLGALGILASIALVACGGDDTSGAPGASGGASGHSGSSGTAGSGQAGTIGTSSGGAAGNGNAGTISQGGNGGTAGNAGGSGGSAGTAGNGGAAIPDASTDTGTKPDATTEASSDVSANTDATGNVDADSGSQSTIDATGPADSGIDVGPALSCDAGEGLQIKSVPGLNGTGWIDRTTNCVGIEGAIFVVQDMASGGSTGYFTSVTNHFCVAGTAKHSAVLDSTHWGVTFALQLNNVSSVEQPYNATSHGVTGFDFTLSGANIPAGLRVVYRVDGEATEYCNVVAGAGAKTALISDAHPQCYLADAGATTPTATLLRRLEFEVPANTTTDVDFAFCVDALTAKKP